MVLLLFLIVLVIYLLPVYPEPVVFHEFLTPYERNYIIKKAEDKLTPSTVSKTKELVESVRKSETAWLSHEDPVVMGVIEKCLKYTDRPIRNCEMLQVLRYKPGGFYKPHQDIIGGDENYRMYTFIFALNDDYEGGETEFPNLNKTFKLKAGDALFFDTLDNYELMTSKALHGGRPVKSGEKWICNLWIKKYPINKLHV
jgi:prolyl 4-hydroxylase